ncbi:MAG TPA: cytochrome c [Kofleriaceae bacterium]
MTSFTRRSLLAVALLAGCRGDCPTCPPPPPAAASELPPASPDRVPAGINAVQNEMRLLHAALRDAVSALALGTLSTIPERLHAVHRARELTEHAVESGAYTLAKNPDQRATFEALDASFHGELEKLEAAASANDPVATGAALGAVMGRCEGCHTLFRAASPK